MENEIWKNIEDYLYYQISNFGVIKSFKQDKINGKILKLKEDKRGYFYVCLSKSGKIKNKYIHILVYETFHNDKLKSGECIHHKNEKPKNNFYKNLKKMTKSEHNTLHHKNKIISESTKNKMSITRKNKFRNEELCLKGENHPRHKLSNRDVYDIRKSLELKLYTPKQLSWMFNIDLSIIYDIKNKKLWTNI